MIKEICFILYIYYKMIPQWVEYESKFCRIKSIDFSVLSSQNILQISQAQINASQLYNGPLQPVPNGPLDQRLGVGTKLLRCSTCGEGLQSCIGHFGYSKLDLPIYHIGYFKHLIVILKMVCKHCYNVLLDPITMAGYIQKMRKIQHNYINRAVLFKKIFQEASKNFKCPHCDRRNPTVQKLAKISGKIEIKSGVMNSQITQNKMKRGLIQGDKKKSDFIFQLNPLEAKKIILNIPKEQLILVNIGGTSDIKDFIIQHLVIPPVCIRPSIMLTNSLSNEDDLTIKIKEIIFLNKKIQETMIEKGDDLNKIAKSWYLMQSHWTQYINSDSPGLPLQELKHKYIRSFCTRLKGKQGRFRQNLSGKRSNYTARTVISPDPNLRPDVVIVPEFMAKILTIRETVNKNSIQFLKQCVEKGNSKRGGANFIITRNGQKIVVNSAKGRITLKNGDIVQRHLRDGDIVIFNRQPSLHRISMMGFKVKVSQGKTLRFNECVCTPFNADFDGDQMNIHVPQTIEARTETLHLMGVTQNIVTPKSGQPIIALIQDFLTTSYLITSKDVFFTRQEFTEIVSWFTDANQMINLPPPTIMKPTFLWTGKQIISSVLRPNKSSRVIVNFSAKEKIYTKGQYTCLKDGLVLFKNSELLLGQIGKTTLGGNKTGLIYHLLRDNTNEIACQIMHRISKLSARWISNFGMTIGISDVTPSLDLRVVNKEEIEKAYVDYRGYLTKFERGQLEAKPGMSTSETLQSLLNTTLSKVRQTVGDNCIKHLDRYNKPLIMALCGSKGNAVNLSQMIGCVGQQTVGGKRITYGFTERSLPHFPRLIQTPEARGFVKNSFYSGLTATEFFFHTMGGRQGIIDTAVKSVTGDTKIIVQENGVTKCVAIGDWVDEHLSKSTTTEFFEEENNLELLQLSSGTYIPTVTPDGKVSWGKVAAVTRHDPGKMLYEIKTLGGRSVIVPESKSLLVWRSETKTFEKMDTPSVRPGNCMPVTMQLREPPIISYNIPLSNYLPKTSYIYGTDFQMAEVAVNDAMLEREHIPSGWWANANGKGFTLPYESKARFVRTLTRSKTDNILPGYVYPFITNRDHARISESFTLDSDNGRFLGLFLAEGNVDVKSGYIAITNNNPHITQFVHDWFENQRVRSSEDVKLNAIGGVTTTVRGYSTILAKFFDLLVGHGAANKRVPGEAFAAPTSFIVGLLDGYFSGDGTVSTNSVEAGSASKELIEGMSMLCSRIGIFAKVFESQLTSNNLGTENILPTYRISIRAQWASAFANAVTLIDDAKNTKLINLKASLEHRNFPFQNDVVLDEIVEINPVSVDTYPKLYDLTVPETFTFGLANGLHVYDTADTGYMQRRLIKLIEDIGVMYDYTVRTCDRKQIIQFRYGDDGLDPMKTQQTKNPVNLKNLEQYIKSLLGSSLTNQRYLTPKEIMERSQEEINKIRVNRQIVGLDENYQNTLLGRLNDYFKDKSISLQKDYNRIKVQNEQHQNYLKNAFNGITDIQLKLFFTIFIRKINRCIIEPGQAIGALTAQSIGQPATQMTLKTFHFAGISSMSITQGVPRVNEIINNTKNIATPIITIYLNQGSKDSAIEVKNHVQKLLLGKILYSIEQIYGLSDCSLNVILNTRMMTQFRLKLSIEDIENSIKHSLKSKIKKTEIVNGFTINIIPVSKTNLMFQLKNLRRKLGNVIVNGISSINRALISKENQNKHVIYAEGLGLGKILATEGVDTKRSYSNHITEIEECLGVQAARQSIINQITETMKEHGVNVNPRHINLLAEVMTCKGRIIGFTRNGVDKMKDSTIMLASFQKTTDFLFDAATQGKHDRMRGISQKIIMGQPITVGTGMFDIKQQIKKCKIY